MSSKEDMEFDVLGYKIRLKSNGKNSGEMSPEDIVEYVREEANKISTLSPTLDCGKVAILTALKIAEDKRALEKEYRENITRLQSTAIDALQFIDEASPRP